jgi:hypothetical protein
VLTAAPRSTRKATRSSSRSPSVAHDCSEQPKLCAKNSAGGSKGSSSNCTAVRLTSSGRRSARRRSARHGSEAAACRSRMRFERRSQTSHRDCLVVRARSEAVATTEARLRASGQCHRGPDEVAPSRRGGVPSPRRFDTLARPVFRALLRANGPSDLLEGFGERTHLVRRRVHAVEDNVDAGVEPFHEHV